MINTLKVKIEVLQKEIVEINSQIENDFDPSEWSGGNFDDCYSLGFEHGEKFGLMAAYNEMLRVLENAV